MKHIFIVNKISGKGSAFNLQDTIRRICESKNLDYKIELTQYEGHASEIAKSYSGQDDITIYSVGGDGTLLEILNGIDNHQPLGIIPAGSGNDFYRMFAGVPEDYELIISDVIDSDFIEVDAGKSDKGLFLNGTSFGIDADINLEASHLIRKTFITKGPAYVLSIVKNAILLKRRMINVKVDGVNKDGKYFIVAIMNGQYYGNGVKASPASLVSDGYLDLILFKDGPRYKVYPQMIKYLAGTAEKETHIERIRCKHIEIDSDEELSCQSDGENFTAFHLEIDVLPKYLKLKMPY